MSENPVYEEVELSYRTYMGQFRPFDYGNLIVGVARSKKYIKVINFEGADLAEAVKDFKSQVDDYLTGGKE